MDVNKEKELYELEPDFFSEGIACKSGILNKQDTCMYFGCECGDGWFQPLKKFITRVKEINDLAKMYNAVFVCDQLKEKYGELTVYWTIRKYEPEKECNNTVEINALENIFEDCLREAENECWNICEICGSHDDIITTKGYIQRICKNCADKYKRC